MEHPPPVPVTHPKFQNLAQREGIRLAGWSGSLEVTSWSGFSTEVLMTSYAFPGDPSVRLTLIDVRRYELFCELLSEGRCDEADGGARSPTTCNRTPGELPTI